MFDVVCSGNLNLDIIFRTSRMPKQYEKYEASEAYVQLGGSAGNTACWLANLGSKVGFIGCVGNDFPGDDQIDNLKSFGVDTTGISRNEKITGIATIFSVKNKKRFVKYTGANSEKQVDEKYLSKTRHVHLTSNPKEYLEKVIGFCKKDNITISFDPGSMRPTMKMINDVDIFYANHKEMNRLTRSKKLETGMRKLKPGILIVGLSGGGCMIKKRDEIVKVESLGVDPVDLIGAGDAFMAGFIHGYLKGYSLEKCGRLGVVCSSICCQTIGPRKGIPNKYEIDAFAVRNKYF
jgi:sugar/nucleoside kinase (ribokinase family)